MAPTQGEENDDAFQTGRLTRSIEIPYYERLRRTAAFQPTWLGTFLTKKHGVRIFDMDLAEDWVLIENTSNKPVAMGSFELCDEDRSNALKFPDDLLIEPKTFLKVLCAPGRTENIEDFEEDDGRTFLLLWKTLKGDLRSEHVLREEGDCMYLYDEGGMMVSAFAKTDDGAFKEYGSLNERREQAVWHGAGLGMVGLRLALLAAAAQGALHTNLSSGASSAHPLSVAGPLLGAWLCDLVAREASVYAHFHDFFGEAAALFADRVHALVVYGTLALFYGDYCGLFLAFLLLDLAACWFQLWASDCGEVEMRPLSFAIAAKSPATLTAIDLAAEAFLLLLYVDHGHVQFRLWGGLPFVATGGGLLARVAKAPLLTLPFVKEVLLIAFMAKQVKLLSQLWFCTASLANTKFPCVAKDTKSFLEQVLEEQGKTNNIEALRNSDSLHTLREGN